MIEITAEKAIDLMTERPDMTDDEIVMALRDSGAEPRAAARVVEFLPMACCRVLMRPHGVRFSKAYRRQGLEGEFDLGADPDWNRIEQFAQTNRRLLDEGLSRRIASRGGEHTAIAQLMDQGSRPENIACTAPVFLWPETGPTLPTSQKLQMKEWWRFGF